MAKFRGSGGNGVDQDENVFIGFPSSGAGRTRYIIDHWGNIMPPPWNVVGPGVTTFINSTIPVVRHSVTSPATNWLYEKPGKASMGVDGNARVWFRFLSNRSLNNHNTWFGYSDQALAAIVDFNGVGQNAVAFQSGVFPGNWFIRSRDGAVQSDLDLGVAVTNPQIEALHELRLTPTSIALFINGLQVGVDKTTNIPTSGALLQPFIHPTTSSGSYFIDLRTIATSLDS